MRNVVSGGHISQVVLLRDQEGSLIVWASVGAVGHPLDLCAPGAPQPLLNCRQSAVPFYYQYLGYDDRVSV